MTEDAQMRQRAAQRARAAKVVFFRSLEEENAAEMRRRASSQTDERLAELKALEDRVFGPGWETRPMVKVWSYEIVDWYPGDP